MRRIPEILRKKILAMWLAGYKYREIQASCNVALATINTVKEETKKTAPDLEDLRRLSILLEKSNINFYDAFRGVNLLDRLNDCGVNLDELNHFIKLVETHFSGDNERAEDIIEAAIKLLDLEEKTGKSYTEIIKEYQKLRKKIPELETETKRLQRERQLMETKNLNLNRKRKELANEIISLNNDKNNLLGQISSVTSISQALRNEILTLLCKFCEVPLQMKFPTKEEYARLVQQHSFYNFICSHCGNTSSFSPQEIAMQIGWTILPPDKEYETINL